MAKAKVQLHSSGTIAEMTIDDEIAKLDKEYSLISHTNAGRLYSTVRRMKAEKERNIPTERRTGFAISVKTSKAANKMTRREWESFYRTLSKRLKTDYPDSYAGLFPEDLAAGKKAAQHGSRRLSKLGSDDSPHRFCPQLLLCAGQDR